MGFSLIPLSSYANETATYYLDLTTADISEAGTNGRVFVTLIGTGADSDEVEIDTIGSDDFERGDREFYKIHTTKKLGRIESLKLRLQGTGGWAVERAYVVAPTLETVKPPAWPQGYKLFDGVRQEPYMDNHFRFYTKGDLYSFDFQNQWLDNDDPNEPNQRIVNRRTYNAKAAQNVIAPAEGKWVPVCSNTQSCSNSVTSTITADTTIEESKLDRWQQSIGASITAGYKVGGAQGSVTASQEVVKGLENVFKSAKSSGGSLENKCATQNTFTINATTVHQWQITADLGFGKVTTTTCLLACTQSIEEQNALTGKTGKTFEPPLYGNSDDEYGGFSCLRE